MSRPGGPGQPGQAETNGITATPLANRLQVAIFGNTNAGKSTLFNRILGQELAIVSAQRGTTTDPVVKAMELLPFGPITLIDTAGLDDPSGLGELRVKRTRLLFGRCDAAIYAAEAGSFAADRVQADFRQAKQDFEQNRVPWLLVLTKADQLSPARRLELTAAWPAAILADLGDPGTADRIREQLSRLLTGLAGASGAADSLIRGLVPAGGTVLMVVPVDSEAPRGRLILPQVQLIRDCLDQGIRCLVVRESELACTLADYGPGGIDLVVTDSQVFGQVAALVPDQIRLTSFSMLLAANKGDMALFLAGIRVIPALQDGDRILISEACTHNTSHEDIGRVKLPQLLRRITGRDLQFSFTAGQDYPADLSDYHLVVHCGACMITRKTMQARINACRQAGVPLTNYGVLLAYGSGVLERSQAVFAGSTAGPDR